MTPATIKGLFFPPVPEKINFRTTVEAHQNQANARITKTALFALATVAASLTLLLTEAAVITWSLALPAIAITVALGLLFYRLNEMDHSHIELIDDDKKSAVIKKRLEKIFYETDVRSDDYVRASLRGLNRLFGKTLFEETFIAKIVLLNHMKSDDENKKSLAQLAAEDQVNLSIHFEDEWKETGRYGHKGYDWGLKLIWNGEHGSPIEVKCKRALIVPTQPEE